MPGEMIFDMWMSLCVSVKKCQMSILDEFAYTSVKNCTFAFAFTVCLIYLLTVAAAVPGLRTTTRGTCEELSMKDAFASEIPVDAFCSFDTLAKHKSSL